MNETVIRVLKEAAGQRTGRKRNLDLDDLAGTWSDEEADAFEAALAEQRRVDPELWR